MEGAQRGSLEVDRRAAAGAAFAVTSVAGVQGAQASGEAFELNLMVAQYSADKTQAYWEELISNFEAEHDGITVNLEVVSWEQINDVITTRVQSGDMPDVPNIDAFSGFAADGLLRAADECSRQTRSTTSSRASPRTPQLDSMQYGIPLHRIEPGALLQHGAVRGGRHRRPAGDLAGAAGRGAGDHRPRAHRLRDAARPGRGPGGMAIWMYGNGGGWVDEEGNFAINSAANVEAFKFMAGLVGGGLTQPNPATTNREDALNLFYEGEVGMIEALVQIARDHRGTVPGPGSRGAQPSQRGRRACGARCRRPLHGVQQRGQRGGRWGVP